MTTAFRTTRRTSYPALMLFGIVYLGTLAIVFSPQSFRADGATLDITATAPNPKGKP